MGDSMELFEYITDRLEKLNGVNLIAIKQKTFHELNCGHIGVIEDRDSIEHFLYPQ
jgi:hypothetical protein